MIAKAGAFALAFLLPGVGEADVAREMGRCVQNQLTELGQDVGGIDGIIGPRTRTAGTEALVTHPLAVGIDDLPRLDRYSAVTWCRRLADLSFRLNRHRPALQSPEIAVTDERGPAPQQMIRLADMKVAAHFRLEYGIRLASRVDFAGGNGPQALVAQARQLDSSSQRRLQSLSNWAEKTCPKGRGLSGAAYYNAIYFCWPSNGAHSAVWAQAMRGGIEHVMAHEIMHLVQRELAQELIPRPRLKEGHSNLGPDWLVEGGAVLVAERFSFARLVDGPDAVRLRHKLQSWPAMPLNSLRRHDAVREGDAYRLASLAVHVLVDRHGMAALFDYWREVGQSRSPEKAFETVFGLGLSDFEAAFDEHAEIAGALLRILN